MTPLVLFAGRWSANDGPPTPPGAATRYLGLRLGLELDGGCHDVVGSDVFQRVSRDAIAPGIRRYRERRNPRASVEHHRPCFVASDEMAPTPEDQQMRREVRVQRSRVARSDHRLDDSNPVVLEHHAMVIGCGIRSVQGAGDIVVNGHVRSLRVGITEPGPPPRRNGRPVGSL